MTQLALPNLPDGFTPEFLTDVLRLNGTLSEDAAVTDIQQAQVGDGTGMMAELAQLHVTYSGDSGDAPPSFIAKFASRNETNRGIALSYNLYERETRFASELDPQTSTRTPITYYSGRDEDRFLLLMEDMTEYEVGSQVIGATLEQTELAVDELAKLHAPFWNKVDDLDWVPHIANSYHATNMLELAKIGYSGVAEKFADYVPDDFAPREQAYLDAIPTLQAYMDSEPVTLVHGDYRMENLLYGHAPGQDPVAVIDWQGPLIARGMNDVGLFLTQSTQTEVRRKHERDLLQRYAEGLRQGGAPALDAEDVWLDYRKTTLYNWVYVAVVAGTLDATNEKGFAWMAQMVERHATAAADLDVYQLMP